VLNLQPTLRGLCVELLPLLEEDFEPLFQAASDPLIWEQHPERERYQRDVFRRYFDSGLASKGALKIVHLASGELIGSSRYHDYRPADGEVEIGWTFLTRPHWGGDTNREVKKLMLDHAFSEVERVLFVVGEHNLRSQKAVLKLGAVLRGPSERSTAASRNVVFVLERSRWRG
jgi:RimJ/RimL family protein N-acetyltransferase